VADDDVGNERLSPNCVVTRTASSRALLLGVTAAACFVIASAALRFGAPGLIGSSTTPTDFNAFYIAGDMAAHGHADEAYDLRSMLAAQRELAGSVSLMPWTYPPPTFLLMQLLAQLPIGAAFALWTAATFAQFVWVLRRIAGLWLPGVLVGVLPAVLLNLRTGQTGFFVASLVGLCLLARPTDRLRPGIPLGLIVLKPHLAAGVAVLALLRRAWATLAAALVIAVALAGLATWLQGAGIWSHFLSAAARAAEFLARGYYPTYRMNSIYAALFSFGAPPAAALAGQVLGALAALATLTVSVLRGAPYRFQAALACGATLMISPYSYDYDAALLGVALAFILPDLIRHLSARELAIVWGLLWLACSYGMAVTLAIERLSIEPVDSLTGREWLSLGAPLLIVLYAMTAWLLMRRATPDEP
jgi:hypothetical protein